MEAIIPPSRIRRQKAQKFIKKHQDRRQSMDIRTSVSSLDDSSSCSYDISSKNSNSSSFQMNYSVNSQSQSSIANYKTKQQNQHQKFEKRSRAQSQSLQHLNGDPVSIESSDNTETQFKSVRELAMQFEKLSKDEKIIFANRPLVKLRTELPWISILSERPIEAQQTPDEEIKPADDDAHSEEEVDEISSECEGVFDITETQTATYIDALKTNQDLEVSSSSTSTSTTTITTDQKSDLNCDFVDTDAQLSDFEENVHTATDKTVDNNFVRSKERPKTEINAIKNEPVVTKFYSNPIATTIPDDEFQADNHVSKIIDENLSSRDYHEEEVEECIIRDKRPKAAAPIIEELIKTEENYVENLRVGIKNYGSIFTRKDLPSGLRGKKFDLLGNIEQICDFHEFEFLPMLLKYNGDLKNLFDEFLSFIDDNCFYGYVLFTMNKKRSLQLCEEFNAYFKYLQEELNDKLGINSFLVQPIQRLARYPLLLTQFINTLFKTGDIKYKSIIESCCKADKRLRVLLATTNESEQINDITDCFDVDVLNQGRFMKVSEFNVFDYTLRRTYRSKAFIFDRCLIYTEIKDKRLIFRGCYPCESIGFLPKTKMFILYYQTRKIQECHFTADPSIIEIWLILIQDMINNFAREEKKKLTAKYSGRSSNDYSHRRSSNIQLYRYSNRYSSDSGIGNVWNMPKLTDDEDKSSLDKLNNQRTTWYMT